MFQFSNPEIADILEQVADLLEAKEANPYRIRAYQHAAHTIRSLNESIVALLQQKGRQGLENLAGIGKNLSVSLEELLYTGHLPILEQLLEEVSPAEIFATIPGIGPVLAQRLQNDLNIQTLEELELAAHDGRLAQVKGFGRGRIRLIRDTLATFLSRSAHWRAQRMRQQDTDGQVQVPPQPAIHLLLFVDDRYRSLAAAGKLRTISPRRFNPQGRRWLPIMYLEREGWFFTAMFSNTARAHQLGRTHDWVIIYYDKDGYEGQCTVVTETHGPLRGKRVVRGRETQCASAYARISATCQSDA